MLVIPELEQEVKLLSESKSTRKVSVILSLPIQNESNSLVLAFYAITSLQSYTT
jgi:hypothetical protein